MIHLLARSGLVAAALLLAGCPLNVNLGGPGGQVIGEPAIGAPCHIALPAASKAEFKAHGYVTGKEPEWKATRAWFEANGKLPACQEVQK